MKAELPPALKRAEARTWFPDVPYEKRKADRDGRKQWEIEDNREREEEIPHVV